jgi:hypothetical protein
VFPLPLAHIDALEELDRRYPAQFIVVDEYPFSAAVQIQAEGLARAAELNPDRHRPRRPELGQPGLSGGP